MPHGVELRYLSAESATARTALSCGNSTSSDARGNAGVTRRNVVRSVATAETVLPGLGPLPAATAEETQLILRWLAAADARLVRVEGTWASPAHGAGAHTGWLELVDRGRAATAPFEDRRGLRPVARPGPARRSVLR